MLLIVREMLIKILIRLVYIYQESYYQKLENRKSVSKVMEKLEYLCEVNGNRKELFRCRNLVVVCRIKIEFLCDLVVLFVSINFLNCV